MRRQSSISIRIKIYGVQAEGSDAIVQSFAAKKRITTETSATIADGIAVKSPGELTVELINRYADDVVTVSDSEIADAILLLIERCKQIVEPAGATTVAAVLSGKLNVAGKRVVCVLSGGNIDVSFIQAIIERGLVVRRRRIKFTAKLADRPGSLVQLLNILADAGANILAVEHDKLNSSLRPDETSVHISCEVGGADHWNAVLKTIHEKGIPIEVQ